ncbi:hypothetical protein SPRG_06629 [Saprolegnia parasitica CBS 223.65]|uniref:PH domain-containing protein n=1 Tax=Saprolegnia parasitica (strain CBS 223.65) TaxID=695850 RepID=A0A067CPD3_SAPPC|nr:hypothetical protein SPRG_06629 [Saprolegnia parasitica CBS 223.65]KDO28391.1 hypothetical protein SPRG_06629 [Saprolegnia parasitica CBS 223.65]|eukprot:XP_012200833.1 hypothetical protein SPRG_06629 [Saprolegnia parasitica CBS 223.65]
MRWQEPPPRHTAPRAMAPNDDNDDNSTIAPRESNSLLGSFRSSFSWGLRKSSLANSSTTSANMDELDDASSSDQGATSDDSTPEVEPADWIDRGSRIHPTLSMLQSDSFDDTYDAPAVRCSSSITLEAPPVADTILRRGWIEKCGNKFKTWKWRYFELTRDGYLRYYTAEDKATCKGSIHVEATTKNDIVIQTHVSERLYFFILLTPGRTYLFSTKTQRAMTRWIHALESIGANARTGRWDPLRNTVHLTLDDAELAHKWTPYEDPRDHASMEGVLYKRGHVRTNWSKRFFRIEIHNKLPMLCYYTEDQGAPKGHLPLLGCIVSGGIPFAPDSRRNYFVIATDNLELHLSAMTEHDMYLWLHAIQQVQKKHPRPPSVLTQAIDRACVLAKTLERVPVTFRSKRDFEAMELARRGEALLVTEASVLASEVVRGAQLVTIAGVSLGTTCDAVRLRLATAVYPLTCEFLLPPKKRGTLIKKSRATHQMATWKERDVVVANGELRYMAGNALRGAFSLAGCWVTVAAFANRPFCIVLGRSPSDKLVLQAPTLSDQVEWASVLHCSIVMASQGLNMTQMRYERPFY